MIFSELGGVVSAALSSHWDFVASYRMAAGSISLSAMTLCVSVICAAYVGVSDDLAEAVAQMRLEHGDEEDELATDFSAVTIIVISVVAAMAVLFATAYGLWLIGGLLGSEESFRATLAAVLWSGVVSAPLFYGLRAGGWMWRPVLSPQMFWGLILVASAYSSYVAAQMIGAAQGVSSAGYWALGFVVFFGIDYVNFARDDDGAWDEGRDDRE